MDNGLIFPYRRRTAQANPVVLRVLIRQMDPFEGYPHVYDRHRLPVITEQGPIEAWVYIAGAERQGDGLRPAREYLEHLLAGRDFLSEGYHQALAVVEAVEHLDDATLGRLGLSRYHPR